MSTFTNNLNIPISSGFGLLCIRNKLIKLINENGNKGKDERRNLVDRLKIIEDALILLNILIV